MRRKAGYEHDQDGDDDDYNADDDHDSDVAASEDDHHHDQDNIEAYADSEYMVIIVLNPRDEKEGWL